jgi:glutathione synthase/RimK-type ligase-like ATP-grasp enzyme
MHAVVNNCSHDAAPVITVLTTRTGHATLRALADAACDRGLDVRCLPRVDPASSLVFPWSYARPNTLAAVREYCAYHGIDHINAEPLGKWDQLVRLADAELPIPNSRRARGLHDAREAAKLVGYPAIIKPNWFCQSRGVELVRNEAELEGAWTNFHRIVQSYLPEGARCTRILVIGDRAVWATTRVAKDGVHATYDHGRRATLEPYPLLPQRAELAVAACRAVGVEIGGVDVVETTSGPRILEVNHVALEFGDEALHGPDAVTALAAWLAERTRGRLRWAPALGRKPRLRLVTDFEKESAVSLILETCEARGFHVDMARTVDPTADATWFWGVSPPRRRAGIQRLAALPIPVVDGNASKVWANRARLFRAGIAVPRARLARQLDSALGIAEEIGYPLTLRVEGSRLAYSIADEGALCAAWPANGSLYCVLEPAQYAAAPRMRVWVAGERAFRAARIVRGRCLAVPVRHGPCEIAIAACRILQIDLGVVDVAMMEGEPVVLRAQSSGRWIARLSASGMRAALGGVAGPLHDHIGQSVAPHGRRTKPRLTVVLARGEYTGSGAYRIQNIHALRRELARRGHRVLSLGGRIDLQLIADADVILQDPLQAFGFGPRGDALDHFLYENAAARCHLLRRLRQVTVDKRLMHTNALKLGVRSPTLYRLTNVRRANLPIIAKPCRGSLGIGVRLLETMADVKNLAQPAQMVLQQFIDSKTSRAISLRVITVVDRIVAAAIFHNVRAICSNLARGGRAIPLTGPGRRLYLSRHERMLLESVGIDAGKREVPAEVVEMAGKIGRYHSNNGAQMIGQDFLVDHEGKWYFLEVNMAFGTAVFNATDGEGFPSNGRGLVHAGRVLADAIEMQFNRGGASRA